MIHVMDKKFTWPEPGHSEGRTHQASAWLQDPNTQIHQTAVLEHDTAKMQIAIPGLNCSSDMNRQWEDETEANFVSFWALIKDLSNPNERSQHGGGGGLGGCECWALLQAVHQFYPLSAGPVVPESSPGLLGPLISSQRINQVFMGPLERTVAQTDY